VGCPGIEVFVDVDGDGYGSDTVPSSRACDLQPGFAMQKGDCNDYRANAHPGAKEICDDVDNNCDGQINEGLASGTYYKDGDGDGYGDRFGTDTRTGCSPGYASTRDDCNDMDKEIHPGAKETCNNVDDNCNGRIDENAKLSCGMGWCRRTADTCASTLCTPGMPQPETCNLVDDDCDGVIDNNARCADGKVCVNGGCISSEDAKMIMAMSDASVPSGSGGPDGGTRADTPPSPPMGGNVDAPRRANASVWPGWPWSSACSTGAAIPAELSQRNPSQVPGQAADLLLMLVAAPPDEPEVVVVQGGPRQKPHQRPAL
jgi:hypothetical protein